MAESYGQYHAVMARHAIVTERNEETGEPKAFCLIPAGIIVKIIDTDLAQAEQLCEDRTAAWLMEEGYIELSSYDRTEINARSLTVQELQALHQVGLTMKAKVPSTYEAWKNTGYRITGPDSAVFILACARLLKEWFFYVQTVEINTP